VDNKAYDEMVELIYEHDL